MSSYGSNHAAENEDNHNNLPSERPSTSQKVPISSTGKSKKAASAFRTISEVADELDVQQHVLRFWETKFSQVKPLKRGGGRRYYRPEDIDLLKAIHHLLYTEKYTIKGVQKLLRENGKNAVVDVLQTDKGSDLVASNVSGNASPAVSLNEKQKALLQDALQDLKDLRNMMRGE